MIKILRIMFDHAFWREFIEVDMLEEGRMMHDCRMIIGLPLANRQGE